MKSLMKILIVSGVLVAALLVAGVAILKSMDFNEYRTLIADQVKSATGRDLVIEGDLDLQISLSPSVAVDGVSFANAEWGSAPEMISMDSFAAEVALLPLLTGDVQVKRVVLRGVNVFLETDATGAPNWAFDSGASDSGAGTDAGDTGAGSSLPVVHSVQVQDVTLTYKDGVSGDIQNISLAVLELSSDGASSPMNLLVESTYNKETFKITGAIGSSDALSANKVFPVKLDIAALGADIALDGTINEPRNAKGLNLGFSMKSDNIAALAVRGMALAGTTGDAPLPEKPFSVTGALRDGDNAWSIDGLAMKIGGSDIGGNVTIDLGGARPGITAELTSTLFDLADVTVENPSDGTSNSQAGASPDSSADDGRVFPNDPLPLDGLKSVDAVLAFKGASVNANGIMLSDLGVELALKDGRLAVSPFGVTFGDGRITGDVTLDGSGTAAKLSMAVDAKQVDYGKVLKDLAGEESLRGKMDMTVQVRGSGSSVRALMAGLDGKFRVQSENGYVDSGALAFVTGPLMALFEGEDAKTLRCAVVDFDITKGKAAGKAIVFETGGLSIVGDGGINLADETLALRFDPRAKNTSFASAAEIGIKVDGTLKEPSVGPDLGDVAMEAASIATGIATGGLSTIVGMAVGSATSSVDETDYCALALAGKPLKPAATASSTDSTGGNTGGSAPAAPAAQESETGIGGVIQGIFGN